MSKHASEQIRRLARFAGLPQEGQGDDLFIAFDSQGLRPLPDEQAYALTVTNQATPALTRYWLLRCAKAHQGMMPSIYQASYFAMDGGWPGGINMLDVPHNLLVEAFGKAAVQRWEKGRRRARGQRPLRTIPLKSVR